MSKPKIGADLSKNMRGVVKQIDQSGRVHVPKVIRQAIGADSGDLIEFLGDGKNNIIIRRFDNICYLCYSDENLMEFKYGIICKDCFNEIRGNNDEKRDTD